jgi:hypothetical protein
MQMTAKGHLRHFRDVRERSAYPLRLAVKPDIRDGQLVPTGDKVHCGKTLLFDHLVRSH